MSTLVTTALEQSWPKTGSVVFLGEWCRLYTRRHVWSTYASEVLPYHWDDRNRLFFDYQYLTALYEKLLGNLAKQLNQIHNIDRSIRYWRIIIGPWLGYFTQMFFDRWISIQNAVQRYQLSKTIILLGKEENVVPKNMEEFLYLFRIDDWNHYIYSHIIQNHTNLPVEEKKYDFSICSLNKKPSFSTLLKGKIKKKLINTAALFSKNNDVFLLDTYLPVQKELQLQLLLKQMPQLWRSTPSPTTSFVKEQRNWILQGDSYTDFEKCIRNIIPKQIPTTYLEGFNELKKQTKLLPWPKNPKLIWTSGSQTQDDLFKLWAADKVENGTPLIVGQHGGLYGTAHWSFFEDHEVKISDYYLSWGWSDSKTSKIKPVGQLKQKLPLGVDHYKNKEALLVTAANPRYSYWMCSIPIASQWLNYFEDQFIFVKELPLKIREKLTIRLYPQDYGWNLADRWREQFPDQNLDSGQSDINDLIKRSRVYISTYNATTFLESFTMDIPTIIYWNPKYWELRPEAIPYFEDLERVGIFHKTPQAAAQQLAKVWDNIDQWWNGTELVSVLEQFKENYCRNNINIVNNLKSIFMDIINKKK